MLVLLAVLAAILVPTLLGYIEKSKGASITSNASAVREETTGRLAELYGKGEKVTWSYAGETKIADDMLIDPTKRGENSICEDILELADVDGSKCIFLWTGYQTAQSKGGSSDKSVSIDSLYSSRKTAHQTAIPLQLTRMTHGLHTRSQAPQKSKLIS